MPLPGGGGTLFLAAALLPPPSLRLSPGEQWEEPSHGRAAPQQDSFGRGQHWGGRGSWGRNRGPSRAGLAPTDCRLLQVESSQAFTWQSQLRHRWDEEKQHCFANICDAQIQYSYEYLGNTPRLVITPLTDR